MSLVNTNILKVAVGISILITLVGCEADSNMRPVTGEILFKGKPVADAKVMFMSPASARTASGQTDAAGKFDLTTFEDKDGAVIGEHKVAVSVYTDEAVSKMSLADQEALGRGLYKPKPGGVPARYSAHATSGLTAVVEANGKNHYRFELEE
ncbi:MAG: hypothetical protein IT423_15120 [Pirellulaceae bacterium]|nr:hypothetical protein [Pirellulaceae bacterium]